MDPQVTLDQAKRFIKKGAKTAGEARSQEAFREAGDKLQDYWDWRERGGFEPEGGDARARRLGEELSEAWGKREEEEARDRAVHEDYYANPGRTMAKRKHRGKPKDIHGTVFQDGDPVSVGGEPGQVNTVYWDKELGFWVAEVTMERLEAVDVAAGESRTYDIELFQVTPGNWQTDDGVVMPVEYETAVQEQWANPAPAPEQSTRKLKSKLLR